MDILSLYYFAELAKDLHITRTANRLSLSQQTLSNHIQRLEEAYGVPLLHRKPVLSLTNAGEAVLEFAELVSREQRNLKNRLSDLEHETQGVINFGASQLRMQASLPEVLPRFSAQFPQVELRLTTANSAELEPKILDGSLDLAIILAELEDIPPVLSAQHLMDDPLYLCMTDSLLTRCNPEQAEYLRTKSRSGAVVRDFSKIPFCTAVNRVGQILQACFEEAGMVPNTYLVDSTLTVSANICFQGLSACVLTKSAILCQHSTLPADLNCFPLLLHEKPVTQSLYLIHRQDRYLTRYTEQFRQLLVEQFQFLHQKEIAKHVP